MAFAEDISGYKLKPQFGNALIEFKGSVYAIGGHDSKYRPIGHSSINVFDLTTHMWQSHTTSGTIPDSICFAAYAILLDSLYMFGGLESGKNSNAFRRLNLESFQWSNVNQMRFPPPCHSAALVAYGKNDLVLYGGIGNDGVEITTLHYYSVKRGE